MDATAPLLELDGVRTWFYTREGVVRAVDGVSFSIAPGETLAVVGESGCGKSVTAQSILRLLPSPPARVVEGSIRFEGQDLLALDDAAMRDIRGNRIAMIFQEPMTSLNPVLTVGYQIAESLVRHQAMGRADAEARAAEMLALVGIAEPARRVREYPHQLSGGMRQRVMIAMALACRPRLLIADEPTTALDVTVQAQILDLMRELRRAYGMAILFITHDLGVVAEIADRISVMYAGQVVESGSVRDVLQRPRHPYTKALMAALPRIDRRGARLAAIPGIVPDLRNMPQGCRFHPRCPSAQAGLCDARAPALEPAGDGVAVRCLRWRELGPS